MRGGGRGEGRTARRGREGQERVGGPGNNGEGKDEGGKEKKGIVGGGGREEVWGG
jgi:hypothetical protein